MTSVSYLQVLRSGRLAGVIAGDAVGKLGDGMLVVALPLLALQMHGSLRPAAADDEYVHVIRSCRSGSGP